MLLRNASVLKSWIFCSSLSFWSDNRKWQNPAYGFEKGQCNFEKLLVNIWMFLKHWYLEFHMEMLKHVISPSQCFFFILTSVSCIKHFSSPIEFDCLCQNIVKFIFTVASKKFLKRVFKWFFSVKILKLLQVNHCECINKILKLFSNIDVNISAIVFSAIFGYPSIFNTCIIGHRKALSGCSIIVFERFCSRVCSNDTN